MKTAWRSLGAVCTLVIVVYAYTAQSGLWELLSPNAGDTYYNLLVQGFRAGQLSLKKEVPPGLEQLADPYDPTANARYRYAPYNLYDLSYYKGKLYLYWGVTPALILFWPYAVLTGHYLLQRQAVAIFCTLGFLASVGLLCGLWRRYLTEVSVGVVTACALALGLATLVPVMLSRCEAYEVSITCGYMLTMLALGAVWRAWHRPERRCRWLAVASVAYGLAVGARPNLLFGAVILLIPVVQAWRDRRLESSPRSTWLSGLLAATGPMVLIGLGLMVYNTLRFGSPFEFGQHYQLAGERQATRQFFRLQYLWFNFRVYFLEPARWGGRFPFVRDITVPPLPAGFARVESPFGILTNIPVVWLALAVPLAWRNRPAEAASILRWFVMAVALLFGMDALTIGLFGGANLRYQVDFLPALVLLAVIGILGLERALAPTSESGQADRPVWRRMARWGWGLLLGFSVAFNLLASAEHYAEMDNGVGGALEQVGRVQDAIEWYERAVRIRPDYAEAQFNLGTALQSTGKLKEAINHLEEALRIKPDYAQAHINLGIALGRLGRIQEAIGHFEQALRLLPGSALARSEYVVRYNLGNALMQAGRGSEAVEQYEHALRLKPDDLEAHNNLGVVLMELGRKPEAIGHCEQALRIKPDYAEAQSNLARARASGK